MTVFLYSQTRQSVEWQPAVDIYKAPWGWLLKFEMAGVRPEDVQVHVSKRKVTVSGCRRDWMVEEACSHYSMEISYTSFRRTLELPQDLDKARLRLDSRDGILSLRIELIEDNNNE